MRSRSQTVARYPLATLIFITDRARETEEAMISIRTRNRVPLAMKILLVVRATLRSCYLHVRRSESTKKSQRWSWRGSESSRRKLLLGKIDLVSSERSTGLESSISMTLTSLGCLKRVSLIGQRLSVRFSRFLLRINSTLICSHQINWLQEKTRQPSAS